MASDREAAHMRKHHFVPQFYLRYFSEDGKRLGLYNFGQRLLVRVASIKHECSRRNYYGPTPELEGTFSRIESIAAEIIRKIQNTHRLPVRGSEDWLNLLGFVVLQKMRTTNAGDSTDAMTDYFAKLTMEGNPEFEHIDPNSCEVRNQVPVALSLTCIEEVIDVSRDLHMHLLINESRQEFVTSDDPVILHNQYCEGINHLGVTGWNCKGLQVFFPISPKLVLLYFDSEVYKVGASHKGCQFTMIESDRDVSRINALQILNARVNVYFAGIRNPSSTEHQCRKLNSKRPKTRVTFVETEAVDTNDGNSSSLLHFYEPLLPIAFHATPITLRRAAKRLPLHSRARKYRNLRESRYEEGFDHGTLPPGRYPVKKITQK